MININKKKLVDWIEKLHFSPNTYKEYSWVIIKKNVNSFFVFITVKYYSPYSEGIKTFILTPKDDFMEMLRNFFDENYTFE